MREYFVNNPITKKELTMVKTILLMLILNMCV